MATPIRSISIFSDGHLDVKVIPQPTGNIRRVRKWGDPVMVKYGFDYNKVGSNFQAVKCYNKDTNQMGAISNYIVINHTDVMNLKALQVADAYTVNNKMGWLIYDGEGTRIHWGGDWKTANAIKWGTLCLGGNLVSVDGYENIKAKLPDGTTSIVRFARLNGFTKTDWGRSLSDLIANGLVHRCYCVGKDNAFVDSPKGICYSPFYDPTNWKTGTVKNSKLYIPEMWLE